MLEMERFISMLFSSYVSSSLVRTLTVARGNSTATIFLLCWIDPTYYFLSIQTCETLWGNFYLWKSLFNVILIQAVAFTILVRMAMIIASAFHRGGPQLP